MILSSSGGRQDSRARLKIERKMVEMIISNAEEFGKRIRERRKKLGFTQGFLSEFSGLSVSFISDLERGKKTAELEKALHLAGLLGLWTIKMRLCKRGLACLICYPLLTYTES